MRRFAVGDDDEGVDVDAVGTIDGEDGVGPAAGDDALGREDLKLLGLLLSGAVLALAQTDEHDAAFGGRLVEHDVDVLGGLAQMDGRGQVDAGAILVAGEAGALEGEHLGRAVGGAAEEVVNGVEFVADDLDVALKGARAEGRLGPRVIDADTGILAIIFKAYGRLCRGGKRCEERGGEEGLFA